MYESLAFWCAVGLYGLSTMLFFAGFALRRDGATKWAWRIAAMGLLPHAMALGLRWREVGHGPYNTSYEVLSANAWLLAAAYVGFSLRLKALRGLGVLVLPTIVLLLGFSLTSFSVKNEVPIIFKSGWLVLHIGFAKGFGATILLAAACSAIQLLKTNHPHRWPQLPGPEELELAAYQLLLLSFLLLGVMIAAGALWAAQSWGRYWAWDPMETSSLATWLVFGVILHLRALHGWRGRRMAYLVFVGLAFALATVYIVTLMVPTIHNSYMVGR